MSTRLGRILVADDSPSIQKLSRHLLESAGFDMVGVANGVAAVEALQEDSFDLVLMDLDMPEMGGLEATRAIRQSGATLPIVGVSALTETFMADRCLSAGMNALLSKPLRLETLQAVLRDHASQSLAESA